LTKCNDHRFFFDWSCHICKEEYKNFKGTDEVHIKNQNKTNIEKDIKLKSYKEFNEERAKKLFEEIFLQYLKKNEKDIWIAPMLDVAEYIKKWQANK